MTRRTWLGFTAAMPLLCADPDDAVKKAAEKWLALLDAGKYAEAWKLASKHHRAQISAEEWHSQVRMMRDLAGKLGERKFVSMKNSRTLAGAPDGDYTILEYATGFEKKAMAAEIVVLSREGGWKIAGYSIH